jgi:hypothetical protein
MARLDPIQPEPPRQRKGKGKKVKGAEPFIRPSEITGGGKPLLDLDADDLRAAGVTFTETDDLEGIPRAVVDPSPDAEVDPNDDRTPEERAIEAWWDEFFDSMVYTIPFSFLFLLLDM